MRTDKSDKKGRIGEHVRAFASGEKVKAAEVARMAAP
jgi:hypothetical protein